MHTTWQRHHGRAARQELAIVSSSLGSSALHLSGFRSQISIIQTSPEAPPLFLLIQAIFADKGLKEKSIKVGLV